ncbi:hypothetical protein PCLA_20r0032 [Pseudomonas citronellolis]|nr:hypothetical protein PCLA_20r0032 [Pseudomonas citronellolis]
MCQRECGQQGGSQHGSVTSEKAASEVGQQGRTQLHEGWSFLFLV